MKTAGIKVGDIVRVDKKGRRFFALVDEVHAGAGCFVTPLDRGNTYRMAAPREIVGHYAKRTGSA